MSAAQRIERQMAVLQKRLKSAVEKGDYYEVEQVYKLIISRCRFFLVHFLLFFTVH